MEVFYLIPRITAQAFFREDQKAKNLYLANIRRVCAKRETISRKWGHIIS